MTEEGVKYLRKRLFKEFLEILKGEIELSEFPKEYPQDMILQSVKALIEQYEKPKQR